jgi:hypothetical protein
MSDFFEKVKNDLPTIRRITQRPKRNPLVLALLEAHQSLIEVDQWAENVGANWPEAASAHEPAPLENGAAAVNEATEIVKGKQ